MKISQIHFRPSFIRLCLLLKLFRENSILRSLQYEELLKINFGKKILDFGGGDKSRYRHLLRCEQYFSVNIDPSLEPTKVIQVGEPIPFANEEFDKVMAINTLEHIFNCESVLNDLLRVLKKNGKLYISTPFLFRIHGAPEDYFRPTPSWYINVLQKFNVSDVKIIYLRWGPLTTGLTSACLPYKLQYVFTPISILLDYFTKFRSEKVLPVNPIGFWLEIIK